MGRVLTPEQAIAQLNGSAKEAAKLLAVRFRAITFQSARRTVPEQSRAMAGNIIKSGDRDWIIKTYLDRTTASKCQSWVTAHPDATRVEDLSQGLTETLQSLPKETQAKMSKHLVGLAFDVTMNSAPYGEVLALVKTVRGFDKPLTHESGITCWHFQFRY